MHNDDVYNTYETYILIVLSAKEVYKKYS